GAKSKCHGILIEALKRKGLRSIHAISRGSQQFNLNSSFRKRKGVRKAREMCAEALSGERRAAGTHSTAG
ncbi:hypothetical protein NL526_29410, partial [Klebsiella pneumoniae]|nr:hypothetical protein [Klebsiella pneumoniae]